MNTESDALHEQWRKERAEERRLKKNAATKAWQLAHPERVRSYWFTEKGRATRDAYEKSERGKEVRRQSQLRNKERIRERHRIHAQKPEVKERSRLYNQAYYSDKLKRVHHMLIVARVRAKIKKIEFDDALLDLIETNIPTHCPCCGHEIEYLHTKRGPKNPSLDRADNSKGYIVGNAFIVCWRCNLLKADGVLGEFEQIIAYMRARMPLETVALS